MAVHHIRVRRHTQEGLQVVGFFETMGKATEFANRRMRQTGNVFRVEKRHPLRTSWETAMELVPQTVSPVEAKIARGVLPKVQDAAGRKGQVLSYVRTTREARVAWLDVEQPGRGELVPVDQLSLR